MADPSAGVGANHQDTELADVSAQDDQRYEAMKQQKYRGVAPSKNDQIWAKAYEKRKSLEPAASVPGPPEFWCT